MARILTHWLSPMQASPGDINETIERVRAATPAGWTPRILVPAVYAIWPQSECRSTLHMDLRPKDPADLAWIRDRFTEAGILFGAWSVPRFLTEEEGGIQGAFAKVVDLFVLDVEPYAGFLLDAAGDPANYIRGWRQSLRRRPHVSVVPRENGLANIHPAWLSWATRLRPQCYRTDDAALTWPDPARGYLRQHSGREATPILDSLYWQGRGDLDLWVLA